MADETVIDLGYIQRRFDTLQRELREALETMRLRDDQREATHQALVRALTSQMVAVGTHVDERMTEVAIRLTEQGERLDRIEEMLAALVERLAPRGQG